MRRLLLVFVLGAGVFSIIHSSLLNFKVMIERLTHKNALIYFSGYGCYCGKGGRGKPRDKTDICCYLHDCCYEGLHEVNCHPYTDHYRYLIINSDIFCQYRNRSLCSRLACECDRRATLCFQRQAKTYSKKFLHYPAILCKEPTPKCPKKKQEQSKASNKVQKPSPGNAGGNQAVKKPGSLLELG
ncbi:basic phospholipase A2 PLA-B-like [Sceloporus undulatus]|uniref:basic phospholipase A2 PLA-B-like n=1 Tax=Sceloporus undulatus TaxID=8520 RepID=UPI001C4D9F67|nr:basic phospholipase A2 PLA-B-like [Sceloporus undulatus]